MARTKASVGAKLSSGKSSKARSLAAPVSTNISSPSSSKSGGNGASNSYFPRPTPRWQKPITNFFNGNAEPTKDDDNEEIGAGKKKKPNVITSDTESEDETGLGQTPDDVPEDLNESAMSVDLLPLEDDGCSRKIDEFFTKTPQKRSETIKVKFPSMKGKGQGKKSKPKTDEPKKDMVAGKMEDRVSDNSDKENDINMSNNDDKENDSNNSKTSEIASAAAGKMGKAEKRESESGQVDGNAAKRTKVA